MSTRATFLALFFAFAGFYLLTAGGTQPWGDGAYQYRLARQVYRNARIDLEGASERWLFEGPDGRQYTTFSLGVALSWGPSLPAMRAVGRQAPEYARAAAHRVANAVWGGLAVALLFLIARTLDRERLREKRATTGASDGEGPPEGRGAVALAVLAGLTTQLWVYAHSDFSEAYQTAALLWAVWAVLLAGHPAAGRWAGAHVGLATGLLMLAKTVYYPLAAVFGIFLLVVHRKTPRRLLQISLGGLLAFVPLVAVELSYNWLRTGHLLDTGRRFDHYGGPLAGDLWVGLHGLLFSSGKGVFWFNPVLIAALFGWPAFRRALGTRALLIAGVVLLVVGLHAQYVFWHGAWSFGPRFLTCITPLALLPLGSLPSFRGEAPRSRRLLLGGLLAISFSVQILGNLYYAGHSIHINNKARRVLLGKGPRDTCGHCHENHFPVHFIPQFSPIAVHAWMLQADLAGWDSDRRQQEAPWAYDFPSALNARVPAHEAPIDAWLVQWIKHPYDHAAGWGFLSVSLGLMAIGGGFAWRARVRAAPPASAVPRPPDPPPERG